MSPVLVARTPTSRCFRPPSCGRLLAEPAPRIERMEHCSVEFFRLLYRQVGEAYHWTDRLRWSDERIRAHLATPGVSLWVMSWEGAPAGYFELREHEDRSAEIAYFRLLPDFIGRGWGKFLLTQAAQAAWRLRPARSVASHLHPGSPGCASQLSE